MNFVARRYKFCCPSFFQALPVVFYADGRENLRRRPWLFRPFFDRAIKRLLLQKANFGVLEGFLNVFLGVEKDKEEGRRKRCRWHVSDWHPRRYHRHHRRAKSFFPKI